MRKNFERFDFDIPKGLTAQLEFRDLERAFGEGIESPSAKEPFFFSVMYHFKGAGGVAIMSTAGSRVKLTGLRSTRLL